MMPVPAPPLLFCSFLDSPGLWPALGTTHGLSSQDFRWLTHAQLSTHLLRNQQTPPMLAHRILLDSEDPPSVTLAGSFILSPTPEDRGFMLYTPFDGLKKFDTFRAVTEHLEQRVNQADEADRLLAFLAVSQRKRLLEKGRISVNYQLIEGDIFDEQRSAIEHCQQLNAQSLLHELLNLPGLGTLLETLLEQQLSPRMPGADQAQTQVSFYAGAASGDPGHRLDTLSLANAVLRHYRHPGWAQGQTHRFSNPRRPALASDQTHWEQAVKTVSGKLLVLLYQHLEQYWNDACADGMPRRRLFSQTIRQQALADILLKREAGIIEAEKFDSLLTWIEANEHPGRRATLETVRLWEYQANFVELAGSLMISHTDACLYTPSHGLQILKDYGDLKDTLLAKFASTGHEDELYGLLNLEERQRFLGFDKPHVSGEMIAGDIFSVLFEGIITKQRQNIEYALQVFRHSDDAVNIPALFDKALDIRSMIHDRLLALDTRGRWSTRPVLGGSQLPSMLLADAAAAEVRKFASILPSISSRFAAQPIGSQVLQRRYLQQLMQQFAHTLFVGVCGEARLRVLDGSLSRQVQAIVDTVFDPAQADRAQRRGLNGFRPDAWSLTLFGSGQTEALPLASCVLLTERGGLDEQHSGCAVLWTPAMGLEAFSSVDSARKALDRRLRNPEKRQVLLENLSPLHEGLHQDYRLGPLHLITGNVLQDRVQTAIKQFLERCDRLRQLKLSALKQEQALKSLAEIPINTNLERASALARALGERHSLPGWLGMASLEEQQLHLELLEQWRASVSDDKDYLHALPTVRGHIQQTLTTLLGARFQAHNLDPEQVRIIPALTLAGPNMSLTDFALNYSHIAQHIAFTVASNTTAALPTGLDRQAVRSLLLSLEISTTFAGKITTALSTTDTEAEQRQQRFLRQLPWQLLQHAHQLKLQQRLSAAAYGLIAQVLDMPDAIARATVQGAHALIRPLELIKTGGAAAVKALGMYLIGPGAGHVGPLVLYAPYHGEQAFSEFENEAALIAALNIPGALQDLLLRRLPQAQQSIFKALFSSSVGQTSEMTLASNPIQGNLLRQLFSDNLALLPKLLASHAQPSAQEDWEAAKNLFSQGIKLIWGLLPGKLAYVQFLWQSFKDFMTSAEALQDHHWKLALEAFIAGTVQMVSLGRLSLESTLEARALTPSAPQPSVLGAPDLQHIHTTDPLRTSLQPFEATDVALKDLTPVAANGTYTELATRQTYAPVAGKVYPVEKPGAVWQIKGAEQPGPVLQHTTSGKLVLDPDRHTVHLGKAMSKMYNRYANDRERRIWLNIEAQGMEQIRARHPDKARMLTEAVDLARFYAFNCLHNLVQQRHQGSGTRLDTFLKSFFDAQQIDTAILDKLKQAIVPVCKALVDPTEDLLDGDRFVVGSNRYRNTGLIAFVLDDDSRKQVHFTEKFFHQDLDWYKVGLTEPFNVEGHARASTLIHELAHQANKAVDIASLEARRPFVDLISTVTGYGAAMKHNQTRFQREALSLGTPREELFSRWSDEFQEWLSLDEIPGLAHVGKEILKVTRSPTIEEARTAFLDPANPHPRIDTILRNADSIAFLICEIGRQLDPVASPGSVP
ncbi:hypothetical protein I1A_002442 [Pseudomonas fluorescens R124]|uniref:Dermonecrotic toxin N-terminal domain-containing protein n=2 Tax=Pseudomonas fluorescens TaxID=294 RepID=A0A7U9CQX2_PSEFL|nr:hypothetical protein I1A_002442 [Pseudomonas fluorescens R124]